MTWICVAIVTLQIADWWTTKILVKKEGAIAEGNPLLRLLFNKRGVRWESLIIKILAGLFMVYLLINSPSQAGQDSLVGIGFWLMLRVVFGNICAIFASQCLQSSDRSKSPIELYIDSIFTEVLIIFFCLCLGLWIYSATGRIFLFWAAGGCCIIALMKIYSLYQLKRS